MFKRMSFLLAVAMMATSFNQAVAATANGVLVSANAFMYNSTTDTTPGTQSKSNNSIYDLKLGYLTGSGLYMGGLYSLRKVETDSDTQEGSGLGASVGYIGASGFFIKGHYLLSATNGDLEEGTGVQADVGYIATVGGPFIVGVELTYRSIEYKKHKTVPTLEKLKNDELFPMLTVGFLF